MLCGRCTARSVWKKHDEKNKPPARVKLFDTTLRDGTQGAGVSLSVEDKLRIAQILDRFGIHYIEGGWPGSNPKDEIFFHKARQLKIKHAKLTAFGSTRRKDRPAHQDPNLLAIVKVKTPCACIFGKSWDLHVIHALRATLDENLKMIYDSVRFLKSRGLEVIYDAEHFFDGFRASPDYALQCLRRAREAGADNLTLCDTNGGSIPSQITEIVRHVMHALPGAPIGIHAHNDSECAVATIAACRKDAVRCRARHGYNGAATRTFFHHGKSEQARYDSVTDAQMHSLTEVSRRNRQHCPNDHQAYTGFSAFAHKGGVHVSAMARHTKTYDHIDPSIVGNQRRLVISELSGQSNVLLKARELKLDFAKNEQAVRQVIDAVKKMEHQGYQFEGAEGSFAIGTQRLEI